MGGMGTITDLLPDAVHAFEPGGLPTRIAIHAGTVWITQTGDGHDHIVRAPAVFCPAPRGRVAVQALGGPVRFAVVPLSRTG